MMQHADPTVTQRPGIDLQHNTGSGFEEKWVGGCTLSPKSLYFEHTNRAGFTLQRLSCCMSTRIGSDAAGEWRD